MASTKRGVVGVISTEGLVSARGASTGSKSWTLWWACSRSLSGAGRHCGGRGCGLTPRGGGSAARPGGRGQAGGRRPGSRVHHHPLPRPAIRRVDPDSFVIFGEDYGRDARASPGSCADAGRGVSAWPRPPSEGARGPASDRECSFRRRSSTALPHPAVAGRASRARLAGPPTASLTERSRPACRSAGRRARRQYRSGTAACRANPPCPPR